MLPGRHYPALFEALAAGAVVRPAYGRHPRLAIWGLVEARLQQADLVVLGGLNEGTWPGPAADDPWMSRQMRREFGIASPERAIGIAAHDFAQALGAPEVALTRAARREGAPTVPSRWLLRLDTVLRAVGLDGKLGPDREMPRCRPAARCRGIPAAAAARAAPAARRPAAPAVGHRDRDLAARPLRDLRPPHPGPEGARRARRRSRPRRSRHPIHEALAEFVRRSRARCPRTPVRDCRRSGARRSGRCCRGRAPGRSGGRASSASRAGSSPRSGHAAPPQSRAGASATAC